MRKLLTALAATSLIGSFFFMNPAPVAAADTVVDTVTISSTDTDIRHVADALATAGRYQTYLVDDGMEITTRINVSGPESDDGVFFTFRLSLVGSGATFGAEFTDTNDMVDFADCILDWTDDGVNDQTSTFREGTIDCDAASSVDSVYIDFPVTVPADGPAVLSVDAAGTDHDFKVYFFSDEPTADTIYVGSGNMTTDGSGSCTTPDFSTNASQPQAFEDQDAIDSALMSINNNDDTVVLCNGQYEYEANMRFYDGDDLFGGTLTIEAQTNGSVVLDGNQLHQLINAEDVDLDITGVVFVDGETTDDGGAIELEDGDLEIYNSEFDGNFADDNGGAIYARYGDVSITDSEFTDNEAYDDRGGAIIVRNDDIGVPATSFSIQGSTFDGNTSDEEGGAVFSAHNVLLAINNSTFTDNTAFFDDGGAVYAKDDATIGFSVFLRNESANDDGGAIFFDERAEIHDSRFVDNFADEEGGAVFAETVTYVDDTVFLRNRSLSWAGALSLAGNAWLDGAIFRANKSRRGGAIDSWGDRLYLFESRFFNNRATRDGGAIIRDGETLFGDVGPDTIFRGNQARRGDAVAIYRWKEVSGGPGREVARTWSRVWVAAGTTVWLVR